MAKKSLGTLTLDLVAKIGGFTEGLDKAGRESEKWKRKVRKNVTAVSKAFAGLAAGAVTGLAALTVNTANSAREIKNLSNLASTSTQAFQKMTFGASRYGIEQEKVADILKDTQDKVGDFLQTGGGPLADFFENIAPLVGVTAQEFKNLSGDQALQLYVDSLEKANLSQADMTFYMEAIASDSANLLPLLRNNGQEFKRLGDEAERTGNVFSDMDMAELEQLDKTMLEFKDTLTGLKNEIVLAALPAINDLMDMLNDPAVRKGLKDLGEGIVEVTGYLIEGASAVGTFFEALEFYFARDYDLSKRVDVSDALEVAQAELDRITEQEGRMLNIWDWSDEKKEAEDAVRFLKAKLKEIDDKANEPAKQAQLAARLGISAPSDADLQKVIDEANKKNTQGIDLFGDGGNFGKDISKAVEERLKLQKKAQKEAAKLSQQIADQVKGWQEQAKTVGFTADKLAIYRLEQMGATAEQIKAVEAAQKDIELFNKKKEAAENYKSLVKDLRTDEEKITDELYQRLEIIKEASGIADEDRNKAIGRAIDGAFGEFDEGKLGNQEQIDTERAELEDWYSEQLEMLEQFRKDRADLNEEWDAKEAELKAEYQERQREIETADEELRQERIMEGYQNILDVVGKYYEGMEGKEAAYARAAIQIGKTLLDEKKRNQLQELWANTHSAAMGAYDAMASIPYIGPILGAAAAATVYVTGASAAAGLTGMAHDGIDSVPQDGTWLLQKGERVTTAETSAKLDDTLDRVMNDVGSANKGRAGGQVTQNINVQGRPDRRTAQQMAQESAKRQRMTEKRLGV